MSASGPSRVLPTSTEPPRKLVVLELLLLVRSELQVLSQPEPAEMRSAKEQLAQAAAC